MTPNLRTAATEPPPASGEFVSLEELERQEARYLESASRNAARAADIRASIERRRCGE